MADFSYMEIEGEEHLIYERGGYLVSTSEFGLEDEEVKELLDFAAEIHNEAEQSWSPPMPSSDAYIWRYLNFTQLLSILERDQIWFTNVSEFEDPYEGTIPSANLQSEVEQIMEEFDIDDDTASMAHQIIRGPGSPSVSGAYVNCWNVSEHQSAALWEQYVDSPQGIAIRTTVSSIRRALNMDDSPEFGRVAYIDYDDEKIPNGDLPAIYHKRESFEHENEFRISYISQNGDEELGSGFYADVDTDVLLDRIVMSPIAPGWFSELVQLVLDRYEVDCELKESDLYSDPESSIK